MSVLQALLITSLVSLTQTYDLTILHTNDVHTRIEQTNKYGGSCPEDDANEGKCYGGVARRHTKVQEIRNSDGGERNVLFLDGGDQFQGTLWYFIYQGLATARFTSMLGYDAGAIGNHEFDNGPEVLGRYMRNISFPLVCCNLDASNEPLLDGFFSKSVVLSVGGEDIGVVGYLTPETRYLVNEDDVANVKFEDEIECLRVEVDRLTASGINKIIAVGHSGILKDTEIASLVEGIDVIVGGHSNTFLYTGEPPSNDEPVAEYPIVVTQSSGKQVYIVQAGAYGKYLGHLDVTFDDNGDVISAGGNPILLDGSIPQDPVVLQEVEEWKQPLQDIINTDVGQTYVELQGDRNICRRRECNLGNLVTDAVIWIQLLEQPEEGEPWSRAAIALWNSGGIRASLPQGYVKLGSLMGVLPFGNEVVGCKLQGRYLWEMLELSANEVDFDDPHGRYLQFSGLKVEYDLTKAAGYRLQSVWVRCSECTVPVYEELHQDTMYSLVTSAFMMGGGDGYQMLEDNAQDVIPYGFTALDTLRQYIEHHQPIIHGEEGRAYYTTYDNTPQRPASAASPMTAAHAAFLLSGLCCLIHYL